jgi:hypothetical protein
MIIGPAVPESERRVAEGVMEGLPRRDGRAINGNGPPTAVVRESAEVQIVF